MARAKGCCCPPPPPSSHHPAVTETKTRHGEPITEHMRRQQCPRFPGMKERRVLPIMVTAKLLISEFPLPLVVCART